MQLRAAILLLLIIACGPAFSANAGPQRIVSLKPNVTDILYALSAGDEIVGVTRYCDIPHGHTKPEIVADYTQPFIERIIALRPSIVIGSMENSSRRSVESLRRLGIEVKLFQFTTFDETVSSIRAIGESSGKKMEADALVAKMEQKLSDVRKKWHDAPQRSVVVAWGIKPLVVAGHGTFLDDLLPMIAARNAVTSTKIKYPHIGIEELIAIDPDVIVDLSMGSEAEDRENKSRPWDGISSLRAMREGKVVRFDASMFRAGPGLPEALARLGEAIHK